MSNFVDHRETSDTAPYLLHINSLQRVSGTPSNFKIQLTYPILYARSVRLLSASIPNSFYVFNGPNNLGVRNNNYINFIDSSGTQKTIIITPGTYTFSQLSALIITQMQSISSDTYTLTLNPNTLLVTFTSSSALFNILWSTGTNASQSAYYELGFYPQLDTAAGLSHTGSQALQISGPLNIFIQISAFRNVIHDSKNFTAAFCIPMNVEFGNIKYFEENNEFTTFLKIQELSNINLVQMALTSDFGSVTENSDWSALLRFE